MDQRLKRGFGTFRATLVGRRRRLWRWRTSLLTGAGIWLLSFPLLTAHPAQLTQPVFAGDRSPADAVERRFEASLHATPAAVVLGEEAPPPVSAPAIPAPPQQGSTPPRPVAPAARPIGANWIFIPRLGLSQPVGWYTDCLGRAAVARWGAWRWSCAGANNTYVMAHNPGVFTPILGLRAGDAVEYGDASGRVHTYHVVSTTIVSNTQLWPLSGTAVPSLTLQTCWTWDGSRDFIVRAVEG